MRIVAWSFGCRLEFIYSVVMVDEQVYLLSLYSLCCIYVLCAANVRIYKGDCRNLLEFYDLVQFNVFSSKLQVCRYLGRYTEVHTQFWMMSQMKDLHFGGAQVLQSAFGSTALMHPMNCVCS